MPNLTLYGVPIYLSLACHCHVACCRGPAAFKDMLGLVSCAACLGLTALGTRCPLPATTWPAACRSLGTCRVSATAATWGSVPFFINPFQSLLASSQCQEVPCMLPEEKSNHHSYPDMNPVSYKYDWSGKKCPLVQ